MVRWMWLSVCVVFQFLFLDVCIYKLANWEYIMKYSYRHLTHFNVYVLSPEWCMYSLFANVEARDTKQFQCRREFISFQ